MQERRKLGGVTWAAGIVYEDASDCTVVSAFWRKACCLRGDRRGPAGTAHLDASSASGAAGCSGDDTNEHEMVFTTSRIARVKCSAARSAVAVICKCHRGPSRNEPAKWRAFDSRRQGRESERGDRLCEPRRWLCADTPPRRVPTPITRGIACGRRRSRRPIQGFTAI